MCQRQELSVTKHILMVKDLPWLHQDDLGLSAGSQDHFLHNTDPKTYFNFIVTLQKLLQSLKIINQMIHNILQAPTANSFL